jgi:hypothetical protein
MKVRDLVQRLIEEAITVGDYDAPVYLGNSPVTRNRLAVFVHDTYIAEISMRWDDAVNYAAKKQV